MSIGVTQQWGRCVCLVMCVCVRESVDVSVSVCVCCGGRGVLKESLSEEGVNKEKSSELGARRAVISGLT